MKELEEIDSLSNNEFYELLDRVPETQTGYNHRPTRPAKVKGGVMTLAKNIMLAFCHHVREQAGAVHMEGPGHQPGQSG